MTYLKLIAVKIASQVISALFLFVAIPCIVYIRLFKSEIGEKPRLVWGSTPIINYSLWSRAMSQAGFESETFTTHYYQTINSRSDWKNILSEKYKTFPRAFKPYFAFIESLFLYDIFFISFNGFFLGSTPVRHFQAQLLRFAKKRVVIIPYGSDSYVYRRIRSTSTLHGLLMSYPLAARHQKMIAHDVDYWVRHADVVIPGLMGPDGFGRWDILIPNPCCLSLGQWRPTTRRSIANGSNGTVVVVHAPNHRGFKGSEFVIDAINKLKNEGLQIELKLLERIQNDEVRRILREEADVLVEQIIVTGHGMNGLEGMASGIPTISNLEDEMFATPMRRWSFFGECPLVSATPENLVDVLRKLATRPELRQQLGNAGRAYVEKYHGFDSAQHLFTNVIDYAYGRKESLIDLYHPLIGEYPNRSPKIQNPLVNNRIVN